MFFLRCSLCAKFGCVPVCGLRVQVFWEVGGLPGLRGLYLWACLCLLFSCLLCLLFIARRWAWLSSSVVTNPLVASPMPVSSLSGFTNTPAATLCAKRWAWRRYCQGLWMRELP